MEWKHKKESKWLIVENRKVHCYLCGRKMLKASQRIYDAESGHYSHAICEKEKQLTGTNERRSAVKKIVAGAGVLGLTAVGVDKFTNFGRMSNSVFSSNAKDQTANPELETVITSQGIILPSLTSDPANPVAGQMWYRSDAGVTAHYDSIQNRVVYSSEINNGNVNVTSKGIVNGLSVLPNDGTGGFGPDTTSGATSAGEIGSPYTQSTGIVEAINYSISNGQVLGNGNIHTIPIRLRGANFIISTSNTITAPAPVNNLEIYTEGDVAGNISCQYNSGYGFTFGSEFSSTTFIMHSINAVPGSGYTPEGFINISNSSHAVSWISYYFQVFAGFTTTGLNIDGFYSAYFYENQIAPTSGTPQITLSNGRDVGFFGGSNYDMSVNSVNNLASISSTFIGTVTNVAYTTTFLGGTVNLFSFNGTFGQALFTGIKSAGFSPLLSLSGSTTIKSFVVNGFYENNGSGTINFSMINNPNSDSLTIDNIQVHGVVTDSGVLPVGYYLTPTLTANPPVSATVYQNTNPYDIEIDLPVYATTSGTAGYVTIAKGSTDTPTAIGNQYVSGDTSSTATQIIRVSVPAGWHYEFTGSGVTFATATPFAE